MSNILWPHGLQHARLPCPSPTPGACSNSSPSSRWCHPAISSSVVPFSSCLQSFPASGLFQWVTSSHEVARVLVWSPCTSRDSQESFPTPQFKSINSSVLSFLYGPTFASMNDYWKICSSHHPKLRELSWIYSSFPCIISFINVNGE